jgi:phospholipid/cholesterol/gamma-HCH transport system permease protein
MKFIKLEEKNDSCVLYCLNVWDMYHAKEIQKDVTLALKKSKDVDKITINLSGLKDIDTAGSIIIYELIEELKKSKKVDLLKASEEEERFIDFIYASIAKEKGTPIIIKPFNFLERSGKYFIDFLKDMWLFTVFIGEVATSFFVYLSKPKRIRFKSIVKGIENAGVNALPIIALTSFLVGVVVAYQSAVQLQKFGANIFIVDMIGISVTRELAPLITAIVVAGRSGSSYTAQIGAMKITRELDAMKTMGFNLFEFIVLPRIIALMIAMPLMIFFADLMGILGGMVVSNFQIDISYTEFLKRLQNVLELKHFYIGLLKGPVFALLIASIGCFRGLQVRQNTESIGRYTTISVVNAIFLVIACDALFSVIFTKLGV